MKNLSPDLSYRNLKRIVEVDKDKKDKKKLKIRTSLTYSKPISNV